MPEFTTDHDLFLVAAAKWAKSHGKNYCPTTAVKHIPNYKTLFDNLLSMNFLMRYKSGNVVYITRKGWDYLLNTHPEIARRRTGHIPLTDRYHP